MRALAASTTPPDTDRVWIHPANPELARPLSAVRSTLVAAGARSLRALGSYERYLHALSAEYRATLELTVAGAWLPLDAMMAHYAACDSLALPVERVHDIGLGVGTAMHDVWTPEARIGVARAGDFGGVVILGGGEGRDGTWG